MENGKQYKLTLVNGTSYLVNVEGFLHLDNDDILIHDGEGKTVWSDIKYISDSQHTWLVTGHRQTDIEELSHEAVDALLRTHISLSPVHVDHATQHLQGSTELDNLRAENKKLKEEIIEGTKAVVGMAGDYTGSLNPRIFALWNEKESTKKYAGEQTTKVSELQAQIVELKKKPVTKEVKQNERKGLDKGTNN